MKSREQKMKKKKEKINFEKEILDKIKKCDDKIAYFEHVIRVDTAILQQAKEQKQALEFALDLYKKEKRK
jgi:hypothetical protein